MKTSLPKYEIQDGSTLFYRLRNMVRYHEKEHYLQMILDHPLKAIFLNPVWKPIINALDTRAFIPFENILSLLPDGNPEKTEFFLNALVRKGFLETKGYLKLNEYPVVSIIIPVRNRPREIAACLQSISRLDYPAEKMDVIVIDDASDDNTPQVISTFPVRLIPLKGRRQASFCRNLAAGKAKGEILAFLDSDCEADPVWLKELIPAFRDTSNMAVGGLVDAYFKEKGLDRYEKVKSSLNMGHWPKSSRDGDPFFYLPSCNLLVRKNIFLQLGGFKEDMFVGEDVDFCWRLQDQGYQFEYRPMGQIYHKHRNTLRHFCSRRFDYGTSEPLLQRTHTERVKQFVFMPSGVFFWGLIFFSFVSGWMPLIVLCGVTPLIESLIKSIKLRQKDISVPFARLLFSRFRSYFAFLYNVCAFVSRYYLSWAIFIIAFLPLVSAILFCMHLLTGIVEHSLRKPYLNLPWFLFYFTMDQLAYQFGVWWGCFKEFFFRPINPKIIIRPLRKN